MNALTYQAKIAQKLSMFSDRTQTKQWVADEILHGFRDKQPKYEMIDRAFEDMVLNGRLQKLVDGRYRLAV